MPRTKKPTLDHEFIFKLFNLVLNSSLIITNCDWFYEIIKSYNKVPTRLNLPFKYEFDHSDSKDYLYVSFVNRYNLKLTTYSLETFKNISRRGKATGTK